MLPSHVDQLLRHALSHTQGNRVETHGEEPVFHEHFTIQNVPNLQLVHNLPSGFRVPRNVKKKGKTDCASKNLIFFSLSPRFRFGTRNGLR